MNHARTYFIAFVMALLLVVTATYARAETCSYAQNENNPQLATCNGSSGASKLFASNKVTIYAPELDDLNNTSGSSSYKQCHTIENKGATDLFVPWKSAREWSAFLSAAAHPAANSPLSLVVTSGCCIPIKITKVGCLDANNNQTTVNLTSPLSLGSRAIGTPLDNAGVPVDAAARVYYSDNGSGFPDNGLTEWGAQGDTSGTAFATVDAHGNTINYQVTYACDSNNPNKNNTSAIGSGYGGWIKMHDSGSCVPRDGDCASGSSTFPNDTPPNDLTTLCATGSVYETGSFQAVAAGGWTWTCKGTGGSGCGTNGTQQCVDKTCTAALAVKDLNGKCGVDNTKTFITPLAPPSDNSTKNAQGELLSLCAVGTTGYFVKEYSWGTTYHWSCNGVGNGTYTHCSAKDENYENGSCGSLNPATPFTQAQMDTLDQQCSAGVASACQQFCSAGQYGGYSADSYGNWTWRCIGKNVWDSNGVNGNQAANCAVPQLDVNGACGGLDGQTYTSVSDGNNALSDVSQLCNFSNGTPTVNFTSTGATTGYWQWTCAGKNAGNSQTCQANLDAGYFHGQCNLSTDGHPWTSTQMDSIKTNPANLCSLGTPNGDPWTQNGYWYWSCIGSNVNDNNTYANCDAPDSTPAAPQAGSCSATTGACAYGVASTSSCDSAGHCTWTCTGDSNTTVASCTGTGTPTVYADGSCGAADGHASYITPNQNLCNSGQASDVSGSGPWSWTCNGTGGSTVSQSCSASVCSQCTGQLSRSNSVSKTVTVGSCTLTGTVSWDEVDNLGGSSDPITLFWTNALESGSTPVNSASATSLSPYSGAPRYCAPCNLTLAHASNLRMTLTNVSGSCGGRSVGDVISATSVSP